MPQTVKVLKDEKLIKDLLVGTEEQKIIIDYEKVKTEKEQLYRPGLGDELVELRRKVYHESKKQIQAYEVISNRQLALVLKYLPKTTMDMSRLCWNNV